MEIPIVMLALSTGHRLRRVALVAALFLGVAAPASAQNQSSAQLMVQIQEMQEQIRVLTGQVEGLQFQLTQMQTLIQRMTEDNEYRFQQLEGGGSGKPQAATEPKGEPAQQLPQTETNTGSIQQLPQVDAQGGVTQPATPEVATGDQPMDFGLGDSSDPLLHGGDGTLGTPLDLSLGDPAASASSGDAKAQYDAAYDAMARGDYALAEEQFNQFIALYPSNPQLADATNYLGESMMRQGKYDDAALLLAEGYKKFQNDARAPYLMLNLGVALLGTEQQELACRTFATLENRYTDLAPAFRQRLADEKTKAQCPA